MKIIAGLGNPGAAYANNRHNTGFMALDYFVSENNLGSFKASRKYRAEVLEYSLAKEKVLLFKPQAFMNLSGDVIKQVLSYHKLKPTQALVIYDELALKFGTVRTRTDGKSAGHNGVESVIKQVGKGFGRIRIGIANQYSTKKEASEFVLSDFSGEESEQLPLVFDHVNHLIQEFITLGKLESSTLDALEKLIK